MNDNSQPPSPWGNVTPAATLGDDNTVLPAAPVSLPAYLLVYDGTLAELYTIFARNLLLILATCGVYYFWGKVRLRQYLWSRFSFMGDRFEFAGRGREMFLGFLMVLGGLFVWGVATTAIEFSVEGDPRAIHGIVAMVTFIVIFFLAFVAQFSAQRYRLTRTRWRGIGGGMRGSALAYAFKACGLMLLLPLTLFLTRPYVALKLLRHRIERTSVGDRPLRMEATRASNILGRYVLCGIGAVVLSGILTSAVVYTVVQWFRELMAQAGVFGLEFLFSVIGYGIWYLVSAWVMASFWALYWRYVGDHIRWGEVRFRVTTTRADFTRLRVWNMLALIFSFGLAYPWVVHRSARILASAVVVLGDVQPETLRQTDLSGAAIGEGLVNAFDPGFI